QHWGVAARAGARVLTAAGTLPSSLVVGPNVLARRAAGDDKVPLWSDDLPLGGTPRTGLDAAHAPGGHFPACLGSLFAPGQAEHSKGVASAFRALCDRANVPLTSPASIQ